VTLLLLLLNGTISNDLNDLTTKIIPGHGHVTRFLFTILPPSPNHIFGVGETRHFKYGVLIDTGV